MLKFFIFSLFLFWTYSSIGQTATTVECATVAKSSWVNKLQSINTNRSTAQKTQQLVTIPVQIHLIVKANGTSNLTVQQIRNELDSVNYFYSNANMMFFECLAPEIIYDDSLYNYEYDTEESILLSQHYTNDVINIYFANTASVNGTQVCGYSQFPPSVDYAVMAASCATNGSTLAHELGHYFGLFHTHGDISQGELVDGSNCSSDGDLICDTPADPILSSSNVNSSCIYTERLYVLCLIHDYFHQLTIGIKKQCLFTWSSQSNNRKCLNFCRGMFIILSTRCSHNHNKGLLSNRGLLIKRKM